MDFEVLNNFASAEMSDHLRKFLKIILVVTLGYTFICLFMFKVKRNPKRNAGYDVINLGNKDSFERFSLIFFVTVADFQNFICGKSAVTLFFRLIIFYTAFLSFSATAFDPVVDRVRDATQFVALTFWIASNVLSDFMSFQFTRMIYNLLAEKRAARNEKREADSVAIALVRIAYCALFREQFPGRHIATIIGYTSSPLRALGCAMSILARQSVKFPTYLIFIDLLFTFFCFAVNGYITNYCYLLLTNGSGYRIFFNEMILADSGASILKEIYSHFYNHCILGYRYMMSNYWSIINSPFKVFGSQQPGMAAITFITMMTSLGPACMFCVHRLRVIKGEQWVCPVYMAYLVTFIPAMVIGAFISTLSSLKLLIEHFLSWAVMLIIVKYVFPWVMEKINKIYLESKGCKSAL